MERIAATDIILSVLAGIAPEIDSTTVDPSGDLRFDYDLDSMDFMTLVDGVAAATGVDIPERDYARIATIDAFTDYVVAHSA
jgi:acyl carrier protein